MKTFIFACLFLISHVLSGQRFADKGVVFLTGKIKNPNGIFFEYAKTGFFDNPSSSVMFNSDGSFSHKIEIDGKQQDIYLYLNDGTITFTVADGDTIHLSWDEKSLKILSPFNLPIS